MPYLAPASNGVPAERRILGLRIENLAALCRDAATPF
jgi:hypothetical protein